MLILMKLRIKPIDIPVILAAFGLTVFSAGTVYFKPKGQLQIVIQGQGVEWNFPIDAEETVVVPGILGNTIIKIHDGKTWVESSPCENQSCVFFGCIEKQGQWAACLPNNVLLMIKGNDKPDVDAAAW